MHRCMYLSVFNYNSSKYHSAKEAIKIGLWVNMLSHISKNKLWLVWATN